MSTVVFDGEGDVTSDLFQCLKAIPEYRLAALQDALIAEWTCASAALEGNTFSLGGTEFFLREGLTVAEKTFREHCEIKGHADALKWMDHLVITNTPLRQEPPVHFAPFHTDRNCYLLLYPGAYKEAPNEIHSRNNKGKTAE